MDAAGAVAPAAGGGHRAGKALPNQFSGWSVSPLGHPKAPFRLTSLHTTHLVLYGFDLLVAVANIVNIQLPTYPTIMFGKNDGEGVILVLYFKISDSFDKEIFPQLKDNIKCYELGNGEGQEVPSGQQRALHREAENSGRHCEPQDLQLSAAEGRLVQTHNQKPVLSRPQHKFYTLY